MQLRKEMLESVEKVNWTLRENETDYIFEIFSPCKQDFCVVLPKNEVIDLEEMSLKLWSYYKSFDVSKATYKLLDQEGHGTQNIPYNMKEAYEDVEWCREQIIELIGAVQEAESFQKFSLQKQQDDFSTKKNRQKITMDELNKLCTHIIAVDYDGLRYLLERIKPTPDRACPSWRDRNRTCIPRQHS